MVSSSRSRAWLLGLILAAVLVQGGLNLVRPVTTYKLLALGAGATTTGFVTAAYAVLPLIVALRLGRLTDGTPWLRQLVMASAALLALAGGIVALAPNVAVITIGSALLGLAHLLFTICGQAMIARYSSDADLDLGFGWFTAAYSVGQAAGPLLGGALVGAGAVTASAERLADVDRALWVGALVPLLAVPLLFRVRRRGGHARSARPAEAAPHAPDRASIGDVLRIPGVASHMFASMGLLAMVDILTAFLPIVGERAGVAPAAGILSRVLLPWMSRRWSRRGLVIASLLVSGLALAVPPLLLDNLLVAGAFLAVGGFFLGIGQPLTMTLVSTAVPVGWRSQALAVRLMGNRVGQVGFPLLAGLVARPFGPGAAVWMTCVVLVLAGTEKLTFGRRAD